MATTASRSTAMPARTEPGGDARALRASAAAWRPTERATFVVEVLGGPRKAARLLDVAASQPSRWASGRSVPSPAQARTIIDVDHVLALALQLWVPEVARDWLATANGHLDGAVPMELIRANRTDAVVAALRAELAGAYA